MSELLVKLLPALGWLFVNVVVPVVAPNLVLWLVSRFVKTANTHPLMPVKDGQLCWVSIGFSAAGLYDLRNASADHNMLTGFLEIALVVVIFASGIIAAGGSVFPAPVPQPQGKFSWQEYSLFGLSLVFTACGAVCYSVVHLVL